ncbi:MAG TPA: Gfo/Idh/MocA family oxidoreductase [Candidatus Hydrogenedentes bacterium]|nr:Gfo/Idh/MocA family oxidoreductase [Candidatus Hydrogenedentota bacterium]HOL78086.1 Gfo/Idh/MocA family oxidoreductase [Candidatus Hydrogenedentota bacterium]HPO86454.1 Gfo/Idh/MocA family oxidoreductase [Candidatus Hydrogenedentota bacterium]
MKNTIRWGILSTGSIAHTFARGLSAAPGAELVAVGSRTQEAANAFGEEFNVPHRHGSYEALANDPDVDVIYVATPHNLHKENTILCLESGKAVLCEKPFAINATEARAMVETARRKKLFLMEAMWSRFIPAIVRVRELVKEGAIGEPRMVVSDFGFRAGWNEEGRLLNPKFGGGGLLDVGVYTVSFASMIFGTPNAIASMAHIGRTGVDEQAAMIYGYPEGRLAVLYTAVRTNTPQQAFVLGTDGRIQVHAPWWKPCRLTLTVYGKEEQTLDIPFAGNGYNYEAEETMRCMQNGKLESDVMPLDETIAIMETMDKTRAQWGLRYPME